MRGSPWRTNGAAQAVSPGSCAAFLASVQPQSQPTKFSLGRSGGDPNCALKLISQRSIVRGNFVLISCRPLSGGFCQCKLKLFQGTVRTTSQGWRTGEDKATRSLRTRKRSISVLSTGGREVGICWAKLKPEGSKGSRKPRSLRTRKRSENPSQAVSPTKGPS